VAKVTMPQLGESVAEGTIGRWLKKPGDTVAKYEPLVEVITDKVNAEVPSPFAGVLAEILVQEGETVPNNAEIAVITTEEEGGTEGVEPVALEKDPETEPDSGPVVEPRDAVETADAAGEGQEPDTGSAEAAPAPDTEPAQGQAPEPAQGPAGSDERPAPAQPAAAAAAPTASVTTEESQGDPNARMTPAVRRLLREHDLQPAQIVGTGGGGRITREDVLGFIEARRAGGEPAAAQPQAAQQPAAAQPSQDQTSQGAPAAQPAPSGNGTGAGAPAQPPAAAPTASAAAAGAVEFPEGADELLIPPTQMRKGIAAAMTRSKGTIPHAYEMLEVDMTPVVRHRAANKDDYQAREGTSLSFVPYVVKAVVEGLRAHPLVNAHWDDAGLRVKRRINVGIAIAVDNGLIVPVIQDADRLSINGLNRAVQDLAARARANRLRLEDLQGGTITVNNTGAIGSVLSQSIINPPQIAIVNMEAIVKRPVVLETPDGDTIAIRSIMNLACAFDHRATDGAQIGRFMLDVRRWLEAVGPTLPIW
jgi:pyruvate/2-oxoglutarate dehydrogenase complex dihydrolipoamide acyltransferase (E2) component